MDDVTVVDAIVAMGARTRGEHDLVDTPELAERLRRARADELGLGAFPAGRALWQRLPEPVRAVLRRIRAGVAARRG